MKKLFLFLFALISSIGMAWAQTKLEPVNVKQVGETPVLDNGCLAALHDGVTTGENNLTNGDLPLTIYYDLGEEKSIGSITMFWTRCTASAYSIYVTNVLPTSDNSGDWGDAVASETSYTFEDNTVKEKGYNFSEKNGRYVIFQFTSKNSWAASYGIKLNEIEVYEPYTQILTDISSSNYIYPTHQHVSVNVVDQIDATYNGTTTWSMPGCEGFSPTSGGFDYGANTPEGYYTLTVSSTENPLETASRKYGLVRTQPDAGIIPAIDVDNSFVIYSGELNIDANEKQWGWQAPNSESYNTMSVGEKHALRVHNFGSFALKKNDLGEDASEIECIIFDVYALNNHNIKVNIDHSNLASPLSSNIVPGWNHVVIPINTTIATGLKPNEVVKFYLNEAKASTEDVLIYNAYFSKVAPFIDNENPVMSSITVTSTTHNTATLTVKATDDNTSGTLTYTIKNSSEETVGTGSAVQNVDVTITITGLTPKTNYAVGAFTVFATDPSGKSSTSMDVPAFTTAAAPTGQSYTNGTHEILVQPRHYTGTFDYELIITSDEAMTGFTDGCYWKLNGSQNGTQMKKADIVITNEGKIMTVRVRSSVAPVMDTPLYILMPGEVAFKESDNSYPQYNWVEVASGKTYDVLVNGDKAAVLGTISSSNLSEFRTSVGNASVVNISGATIANDINELTTNNANVLFEYANNTEAAAATKTSNNVYYVNVRFYGAPNGLTFVDDPSNVPLLPEKAYTAMSNGKLVINRSIAADKYVTSFMSNNAGSMEAVLEDGLEAYELTAAQAGQLTFTKVDGNISKGKGYVIHNTSSGTLNMKWQSFGAEIYLDNEIHNQAEDDVTAVDGVKILGTMHTVETTASDNPVRWILSGGNIKQAKGAKISAYRAYFTGVSAAGARAIFVDGETTKIGSINANGEINVEDGAIYNLAGQRVQNPKKGIYIINGKKVVIK